MLDRSKYLKRLFVRHRRIIAPVLLLDTAKLMPYTGKLMPQCILLNTGKLMPHAVYFVRCRQINAPVYLLDTGTLMPQCIVKYRQITVFVKRR